MKESGELAGRHALVTGAGRGIGAEIARTLADVGARVTLVARTASDVQAVAAMIERAGGNAAVIAADLNDVSALGPLIGEAVARSGGLDFLIHNAGGPRRHHLRRQPPRRLTPPSTSTSPRHLSSPRPRPVICASGREPRSSRSRR